MTATHNHDNPQLITCATKIRKRRQFVASYQNIPQLLFGCHLDITFAQHYPASAVLELKEINVLVTYFCCFQQYPVLLFSFSITFFRLTFSVPLWLSLMREKHLHLKYQKTLLETKSKYCVLLFFATWYDKWTKYCNL